MTTLLFVPPAAAEPLAAAVSAQPKSPPATFSWPAGATPCRADVVLGADGVVIRVEQGTCGDALQPVLAGLVGLAFDAPGRTAVLEVRLFPPPATGADAVPAFRPLSVKPDDWPTKWPDDLASVPPRTRCTAEVLFEAGEKASSFALGDCPAALAKVLTKEFAKAGWTVRTSLTADAWSATVTFAWVEDPARADKRLLVVEGSAQPKMMVAPDWPQGMTGGTPCPSVLFVEPTGIPSNVTVLGCEPPWNSNARRALQKWTFLPRVVDGEPVADEYVTTVKFSMN